MQTKINYYVWYDLVYISLYLITELEFFIYYMKICEQGGKLFRNSSASLLV